MQFLPTGLKGIAVAALAAAIVSSLASMLNSTSTIFTMDIYKQYINPKAGDKEIVRTGRLSAGIALLIAIISFTNSRTHHNEQGSAINCPNAFQSTLVKKH